MGQVASKRDRHRGNYKSCLVKKEASAKLSAESIIKTISRLCKPMSSFKLTLSGDIGIHLLRCATPLALPGTLPFQQEADRR